MRRVACKLTPNSQMGSFAACSWHSVHQCRTAKASATTRNCAALISRKDEAGYCECHFANATPFNLSFHCSHHGMHRCKDKCIDEQASRLAKFDHLPDGNSASKGSEPVRWSIRSIQAAAAARCLHFCPRIQPSAVASNNSCGVLWFVHISKCAGTAFSTRLRELAKHNGWGGERYQILKPRCDTRRSRVQSIASGARPKDR
jgi:hypothetical protein